MRSGLQKGLSYSTVVIYQAIYQPLYEGKHAFCISMDLCNWRSVFKVLFLQILILIFSNIQLIIIFKIMLNCSHTMYMGAFRVRVRVDNAYMQYT